MSRKAKPITAFEAFVNDVALADEAQAGPDNADRARWADAAVDAFNTKTGTTEYEEAIGDLIADLGHLAEREGLDFMALARRGIADWQIEKIDPSSLDRPEVTITIAVIAKPPAVFNHAFDLGFSLESHHPHGEDVTPAMLRGALEARLASLSDDELLEAVGAPFDTYAVDPPAT